MLWIGIIIGMFLGVIVGIFILSVCVAANKGDKQMKAAYDERQSILHANGSGQ
jgi:uncharacterized membrane-anchored protein YhcB (DUF1043 family)